MLRCIYCTDEFFLLSSFLISPFPPYKPTIVSENSDCHSPSGTLCGVLVMAFIKTQEEIPSLLPPGTDFHPVLFRLQTPPQSLGDEKKHKNGWYQPPLTCDCTRRVVNMGADCAPLSMHFPPGKSPLGQPAS